MEFGKQSYIFHASRSQQLRKLYCCWVAMIDSIVVFDLQKEYRDAFNWRMLGEKSLWFRPTISSSRKRPHPVSKAICCEKKTSVEEIKVGVTMLL